MSAADSKKGFHGTGLTAPMPHRHTGRALDASGAGRGNPRFRKAHSANPADSGAFFMPEILLWRAGRGTRKRGRFPYEPVFHPRSVRLPTAVESGRDGSKPHRKEFVMSSQKTHAQVAPETSTSGQIQAEIETTPTKPAKLKFKPKAACPSHRLPFVYLKPNHGGVSFWSVPSAGDYFTDYKVGEAMAKLYLKHINETAESGHSGLLQLIVGDMTGAGFDQPRRAHMIGFLTALEPWLTVAVRLRGRRLCRASGKAILDAVNALLAGEEGGRDDASL